MNYFRRPPSDSAGFRQPANDLYVYSPSSAAWTALTPTGAVPPARYFMGFSATPDGKLYTFGGFNGGERPAWPPVDPTMLKYLDSVLNSEVQHCTTTVHSRMQ